MITFWTISFSQLIDEVELSRANESFSYEKETNGSSFVRKFNVIQIKKKLSECGMFLIETECAKAIQSLFPLIRRKKTIFETSKNVCLAKSKR